MMFNEGPFLDRFDAAANAGLKAVEFLFPYEHSPDDVWRSAASQWPDLGVVQSVPGDWNKGERGFCCVAGSLRAICRPASSRRCPMLRPRVSNMIALDGGHRRSQRSERRSMHFAAAVAWTAEALGKENIDLVHRADQSAGCAGILPE